MMLPEEVRDDIKGRLWALADDLGWSALGDAERSKYYERWTKDPTIGGRLGHFMDPRKVRVYIKDSLIKPYERQRLSQTEERVWSVLGLKRPSDGTPSFIKPHGRLLPDGVICWGKSRDWKLILMAAFERAARAETRALAVVLMETGKTSLQEQRQLVERASALLQIERVAWVD